MSASARYNSEVVRERRRFEESSAARADVEELHEQGDAQDQRARTEQQQTLQLRRSGRVRRSIEQEGVEHQRSHQDETLETRRNSEEREALEQEGGLGARYADRDQQQRQQEIEEEQISRRSRDAERARIRRQREGSEQRRVRHSRNAERERLRRERESSEQRRVRQSRNAERERLRRERESSEQRRVRQSRNAERERLRRERESSEQSRVRQSRNAERERLRRERESSEQSRVRQSRNAERERLRRERESLEQSRVRQSRNAERERLRRERESSEQRRARQSRNAERERARREEESEEQQRARLSRQVERNRAHIARESDEEQRSRQLREAARARTRRLQETDNEHQARIAVIAQAVRTRRASLSATETQERRLIESERHRTHARNMAAGTRRAARMNVEPEEHYDGPMNVECASCGARHFKSESKPGRNTFNDCCNHGTIHLEHFVNFPAQLHRLLTSQDAEAKEFREHIRNYNSAFAFASIGAQLDSPRRGPYCFRIHGQIYHRIGPARPERGRPPRYDQVYILDTEMAAEERAGNPANINCNPALLHSLSALLHQINPFAHAYKMLNEVALEEEARAARESRSALPVKMVFQTTNLDTRRYNAPTANEVAVVYVGEEGDVPAEHNLAVHLHSGGLQNIHVYDDKCDPLSYPILFPRGERGWNPLMQKSPSERRRTRISQKEYYSHMIADRPGFNPLHFAGKLYQQFLVDSYVKIEQNRLHYDRTHQIELRVDTYRGLADYVAGDMDIEGPPGTRRIILPSSFPGSPRAMVQNYQDAMAIVSKYGKPDLFITFTCNPAWREITEQLKTGQTASDRPDIVARVFHIKLQELFKDLLKRHVLGTAIAYISVMEWQKRGLPHCHILLTLAEEDKPRSVADVDSIVQAVIPDPLTEPRLHHIVTTCMMHRPCGPENPSAPCMVDGRCSKRFPKQFRETTNIDGDGYPEYRRPNDGRTVVSGVTPLDNRSVVPYNRYLALRYKGHLNVEICAMVQAVKYMYKYVYKGPDRTALHFVRTTSDGENRPIDEIDSFVNARYVCAPESAHRLLGFDLQTKSDTVYRLQVHLPEHENVTFRRGEEEEALRRAAERDTTLTAYFKLNAEHESMYGTGPAPEGEIDARTLFYVQLPEYFAFNPQTRR